MPDAALLGGNLDALGRRDPALARALRSAARPRRLDAVLSRAGLPVPRLEVAGRAMALHSTVDPVREAERAVAAGPSAAYRVCLGLGGGYHLPFLLSSPGTERLLVVETDLGTLRGLLELVDLRVPLRDPRLALLAEPRAEAVGQAVLEDYLPSAYGSFGTFSLRARVDADRSYFAAAGRAVEDALAAAARDYTVQSRFGRRWMRNTLANLRALREPRRASGRLERPPPGRRRLLVTGAGPSLEAQLGRVRELARGGFLLATDASLAPLLHAGIAPDAVLSVDCQQVVYHHFLCGLPSSCRLVLDLASPPLLARLSPEPVFVATGHPLSRYLEARGLGLRAIDASGGNVSHAAVSLARELGAEEIRLFGVDLSYPAGKPYARGCFLYPALSLRSVRLEPLESAVASFALSSPSTRRAASPCGAAYLTEVMAAYRLHLRSLAASPGAPVVEEPGCGVPLELPAPAAPAVRAASSPDGGSGGRAVAGPPVAELLISYLRDLDDLPTPAGPFAAYLASLSRSRREALATLLPVVAAWQATHGFPLLRACFEEVRREVREAVLQALSPAGSRGAG